LDVVLLIADKIKQSFVWHKDYKACKEVEKCQVPVAHTYNHSYSGGINQEGGSLKPAWANSLQDTISKKSITKKGW
jgi:hypothetical protein